MMVGIKKLWIYVEVASVNFCMCAGGESVVDMLT